MPVRVSSSGGGTDTAQSLVAEVLEHYDFDNADCYSGSGQTITGLYGYDDLWLGFDGTVEAADGVYNAGVFELGGTEDVLSMKNTKTEMNAWSAAGGSFTVMFRADIPTITGNSNIIGNTNVADGWWLRNVGNNRMLLRTYNNSTLGVSMDINPTSATINEGGENVITVGFDDATSTAKIWINGTSDSSTQNSSGTTRTAESAMIVGGRLLAGIIETWDFKDVIMIDKLISDAEETSLRSFLTG